MRPFDKCIWCTKLFLCILHAHIFSIQMYTPTISFVRCSAVWCTTFLSFVFGFDIVYMYGVAYTYVQCACYGLHGCIVWISCSQNNILLAYMSMCKVIICGNFPTIHKVFMGTDKDQFKGMQTENPHLYH